jgi:D-amino-acid oxidase
MALVIDTDKYTTLLQFIVACKGRKFVTGYIKGDLLGQEDLLLNKYDADGITHAVGLGSFDLAAEKSVYPLHGHSFVLLTTAMDSLR